MANTIQLEGIECTPVSKDSFKVQRNDLLRTGQQEPLKDRLFKLSMGGFAYVGIIYHKDLNYIYITLR